MKNLRYILIVSALAISAALSLATGCGGQIIPAPPAEIPEPVTINYLDGGEGIPVDSTFKYIFSRPVKASTVNASTFFMVKHEPPIPDPICDPSYAIDATVESLSDTEFVLTPTEPLEYSTTYTICLTQEIQYATGEQFEGVTATFTTEVEGPLSLNTLDGAVDVPVDSTFRYRFLREVDASTVNESTYFIVPVQPSASMSKATLDPVVCDPVNAIDSEISCTQWSCTIEPAEILDYLYNYTACLTSDIEYAVSGQTVGQLEIQSQASFGGFMAGFTTAQWIISSIKLVRLDGTELELTDRPIPRTIHIIFSFDRTIADESQQQIIRNAIAFQDGEGTLVDGDYTWSGDANSLTFIPSEKLDYQAEYTIQIDAGALPFPDTSNATGIVELTFTTMTKKDINGDGFADVIVGASGFEGGAEQGRAYIFLGSASGIDDCDLSNMTCVADTTISGGSDGDQLGLHLAIAGDVNADGFEDIVVAAPFHDSSRGRAYILHGSASGIRDCDLSSNPPCVPDATITGENADDSLGYDVSGAGDINDDGFDDIAVGAVNFDQGDAKGRVYLFLGSSSGISDCDLQTCSADAVITGKNPNDSLGESISPAGDVNDDGYDDIIIGAPNYTDTLIMQGRAYLFLGSSHGIDDCDLQTCSADATFTGENLGDLLGFDVASAGDVNGDGYDDVMMGAIGYPALAMNGRVYMFLGSEAGIASCDLTPPTACSPDAEITGADLQHWLGHSVSTAGDVDADGYDDIIIGASLYSDALAQRGQAYLFLGSPYGIDDCDLSSCTADATFTGAHEGDTLGHDVSGAGDIDNDGYDDIILSAGSYLTYSWQGQVYLFLGSEEGIGSCNLATCTADTALTGESDGDIFGCSVK